MLNGLNAMSLKDKAALYGTDRLSDTELLSLVMEGVIDVEILGRILVHVAARLPTVGQGMNIPMRRG